MESNNQSANPKDELPSLLKYSDLFHRLLDPVLLLDPDTFQVLDANEGWARLFEIEIEETLGKNILDYMDQREQEISTKNFRMSRRRYYPREFDTTWRTFSGRRVEVRVSCCVLERTDNGQVLQAVVKDMTQQRTAEKKASEYLDQLKAYTSNLEKLSTTDEMTGLSNYRYFKAKLAEMHETSKQNDVPYSILFCDVDNFKHYNDKNGHPAGDDLLRALAKVLNANVRSTDMIARYGGEEFAILCPNSFEDGAKIVAERIQSAIRNHPFTFGEHQPLGHISISMGIASFPADAYGYEELLECSDQACYFSKKNGRDRFTPFSEIKSLLQKVAS